MNIVENEAKEFYQRSFLTGVNSLKDIKSNLDSKLYNFNRDRDKLDFLKILRTSCVQDIEDHISGGCVGVGCSYEEPRNRAIFAIEQEIESINKYYDFEPKKDDTFSSKEESDLHSKLNDILEKLQQQGFGQQIIFDEIEELKNHFNLGKKTWFQLVKGKLMELTMESVLEKTVVQNIYNNLSDGYDHINKLIE